MKDETSKNDDKFNKSRRIAINKYKKNDFKKSFKKNFDKSQLGFDNDLRKESKYDKSKLNFDKYSGEKNKFDKSHLDLRDDLRKESKSNKLKLGLDDKSQKGVEFNKFFNTSFNLKRFLKKSFEVFKNLFNPFLVIFSKISQKLDSLVDIESNYKSSDNNINTNTKNSNNYHEKINKDFIKHVSISNKNHNSSLNSHEQDVNNSKINLNENQFNNNNNNKSYDKNELNNNFNSLNNEEEVENEFSNEKDKSLRFLKNMENIDKSLEDSDKNQSNKKEIIEPMDLNVKKDLENNSKKSKNSIAINNFKKLNNNFDQFKKNKTIDDESFREEEHFNDNKKAINLKNFLKINPDNFKDIKDKIVTDDEAKTIFGAAIFGLILIVLVFSAYYFIFYQPSQEELNSAKIAKLNELNSLYKGPLAIDDNAFILKSQIDAATSPEEIESIDILRPATESWKYYQNKEINIVHDDFDRVMATYNSNTSKNTIMNIESAHEVVANNDGFFLANIEFNKPDTIIIPILITRLQAGAGLISTGSIVDIYSLNSPDNNENQVTSDSNTSNDNETDLSSNETINDNNSFDLNSSYDVDTNGPDVSGATVIAIMRSKDSGVVDANYIKSQTITNGNFTNQIENSKSFSTDVEEMLRGAISGGFDEKTTTKLLEGYGLKLSDYERTSNIAELDVEYLLLIEVPRDNVPFLINNMENLILTIPTNSAPDWMLNEMKNTYN